MNQYLLTILISNKLDEKARGELLDDVRKSLGEIKKEDLWGNRELAYQINHQDNAFYAHFEFDQNPSAISTIDKKLKLEEDIIRYLLIRK